jgi:hypothetical protein
MYTNIFDNFQCRLLYMICLVSDSQIQPPRRRVYEHIITLITSCTLLLLHTIAQNLLILFHLEPVTTDILFVQNLSSLSTLRSLHRVAKYLMWSFLQPRCWFMYPMFTCLKLSNVRHTLLCITKQSLRNQILSSETSTIHETNIKCWGLFFLYLELVKVTQFPVLLRWLLRG